MKMLKKFTSVFLAVLMLLASLSVFGLAAEKTEKPFENSEFYTFGDYTLHYRVFDVENAKDQIFLLHGFGLSTSTFDYLVEELNRMGYRCVCADFPSFGYSSRERYSTEYISREDLMYSLMTSLNSDPWILAGHSMGGGVALNIAAEHCNEGKISSLVLFCPAAMESKPEFAKKLMASPFMAEAMETVFRIFSHVKPIFKAMLKALVVDDEFCKSYNLDKIQKPLEIDGTGRGICIGSAKAKGMDANLVSKISIPVLMFTAEKDNIVKDFTAIKNALGEKATYYTVSGGGHMAHENKAAEIAGVIDKF